MFGRFSRTADAIGIAWVLLSPPASLDVGIAARTRLPDGPREGVHPRLFPRVRALAVFDASPSSIEVANHDASDEAGPFRSQSRAPRPRFEGNAAIVRSGQIVLKKSVFVEPSRQRAIAILLEIPHPGSPKSNAPPCRPIRLQGGPLLQEGYGCGPASRRFAAGWRKRWNDAVRPSILWRTAGAACPDTDRPARPPPPRSTDAVQGSPALFRRPRCRETPPRSVAH